MTAHGSKVPSQLLQNLLWHLTSPMRPQQSRLSKITPAALAFQSDPSENRAKGQFVK